ncbi:MAG: DUF4126 domain-containing protein [Sphingobacteriales bacterium]|nr:DUF4126 domain-containing protein [Sphingobacteriales bacterium]MBI3719817.1 DUF4126 domain-containing protein [Sphingobacteriales bacterium]
MPLNTETITAIALGISLSASAGFRVFVPMLALSIAGYFHWVQLPADMHWLVSIPSIACFSVATILEIAAYYIPFIDNLLDSISTPLAVIAGTILAYALFPGGSNTTLIKWVLSLLSGGTAAGTIQVGTGILRLFSSKTTAGTGNAVLATGENAAAISSAALSFVIPLIVASILIVIILWVLVKIISRGFK